MVPHNTHHIWYDLSLASKSKSMAFEHCKQNYRCMVVINLYHSRREGQPAHTYNCCTHYTFCSSRKLQRCLDIEKYPPSPLAFPVTVINNACNYPICVSLCTCIAVSEPLMSILLARSNIGMFLSCISKSTIHMVCL